MARLWLHAVVDHVDEELHVALGLHEPTHVGQAREECPPLEHDGGDDRVEGPLAAHQRVRVIRLEGEVGAAVLQAEAAALGHDGGAEAAEVGVDHRDCAAGGVDHLEAHRVGLRVGRAAPHVGRRLGRVEGACPLQIWVKMVCPVRAAC